MSYQQEILDCTFFARPVYYVEFQCNCGACKLLLLVVVCSVI